MPTLKNWRIICISEKQFLVAHDVSGHPLIEKGPILTSEVVKGDLKEGGSAVTKSGTIYDLHESLPEKEDCEFARDLLMIRVFRAFNMQNRSLTLDDLKKLDSIIDKIICP
ncbi:MAG: hypothetical protein KUA37_06820 [Desulfomicrobium sp.]|jgi:hypothetical protein|nr:hypothetical protein [Pseudomonadota bacterium]MBV1711704.1 hypothetical protein [Desulfomicrobium sp.]MBU4572708.1 hypothetical protein [Pseudomonadota bacterium]MBU4593511.1 hypothetical protein [Pseudomonadota bacterium]MBV1720433.1 hypothetical protein [Desulfomicrobium sp.]